MTFLKNCELGWMSGWFGEWRRGALPITTRYGSGLRRQWIAASQRAGAGAVRGGGEGAGHAEVVRGRGDQVDRGGVGGREPGGRRAGGGGDGTGRVAGRASLVLLSYLEGDSAGC